MVRGKRCECFTVLVQQHKVLNDRDVRSSLEIPCVRLNMDKAEHNHPESRSCDTAAPGEPPSIEERPDVPNATDSTDFLVSMKISRKSTYQGRDSCGLEPMLMPSSRKEAVSAPRSESEQAAEARQ